MARCLLWPKKVNLMEGNTTYCILVAHRAHRRSFFSRKKIFMNDMAHFDIQTPETKQWWTDDWQEFWSDFDFYSGFCSSSHCCRRGTISNSDDKNKWTKYHFKFDTRLFTWCIVYSIQYTCIVCDFARPNDSMLIKLKEIGNTQLAKWPVNGRAMVFIHFFFRIRFFQNSELWQPIYKTKKLRYLICIWNQLDSFIIRYNK